jgi:hypothetical protein
VDTSVLIVAALVIVVLLVVVAMTQRQRSEKLKERFGPEYDHAVDEYGDKRRAEEELAAREKRVEGLSIRTLTAKEHSRFSESWREVQARFVDDPTGAIVDADQLVKELMETRGYPMGNFEQRAADISVDHPTVVTHYRAAREIALRNRNGSSDTEQLRQAMVHYRALFHDLLETAEQPIERTKEVVR